MEKNILTEYFNQQMFDEVTIYPTQVIKYNKRIKISNLPPLHESKRKKMFAGKAGPEKLFDTRKTVTKICPYKLPEISHKLSTKATNELEAMTISGVKTKSQKEDCHLKISNVQPIVDSDVLEITQLEPHFFSCVEGRPIRDVCDRQLYMAHMRSLCLVTQKTALSKDIIVNIDSQYIREAEEYDEHVKYLEKNIADYEQFVVCDYDKCSRLLGEGQQLVEKILLTDTELNYYTKKVGFLSRSIMELYYKISRLRTFQRFLYHITPSTKNNTVGKQRRGRHRLTELLVDVASEKAFEWKEEKNISYMDALFQNVEVSVDEPLSINEIINFSQALLNETPTLYFDKPFQIKMIFNIMAQLACICLEHESIIARELQQTKKDLVSIKNKLVNELEENEDTLKTLLHTTEIFERQADDLKAIYDRTFKKAMPLFISKFNLSLTTNIEWLYQLTVGKNETKSPTIDLLREMEIVRESYLRVLDKIDIDILKKIEKEVNTLEIKTYNAAVKANLELSRLEHFKQSIIKTFGRPLKFQRADLQRFRTSSSKQVKKGKRKLTEKELYYIKMFTSWCEGQNPFQFLGGQEEINEILGFKEF